MPFDSDGILNNIACRQIADDRIEPEKAVIKLDQSVAVLLEIVKGLNTGSDLSHVREEVMRFVSHQQGKLDLVKALMQANDITRLSRFTEMRDVSEQHLFRLHSRGDLTTPEWITLYHISTNEIKTIQAGMKSGGENNQSGVASSSSLIDELDVKAQQSAADAEERYKGTSPQGREVIRKHLCRVQKALKAAQASKQRRTA